ncbi:MAG: recombinase zinc beta ribbon domain-containing protein [Parcubacteria group bacterium]|nr:recombinase zinc beta ribbon domain-containing protein [Parcubacteria group bacterium]
MVCGLCGSGITADEKFKKLKDGSTNRYVYYGCTKSRDKHCKNKYLREDNLIEQLLNIIDRINLDKLGMKNKIEKEIKKYRHFQKSVLGINKKESKAQKEIDMKNYAKYILKEGNIYEQRELLGCLRSKLVLKEKEIRLR